MDSIFAPYTPKTKFSMAQVVDGPIKDISSVRSALRTTSLAELGERMATARRG